MGQKKKSVKDAFRALGRKFRINDASSIMTLEKLLWDGDGNVDKLLQDSVPYIVLNGVKGCAKTLHFLVARDRIARRSKQRVLPVMVDCAVALENIPNYTSFVNQVNKKGLSIADTIFEVEVACHVLQGMLDSAKSYQKRHEGKTKIQAWLLKKGFIKDLQVDLDLIKSSLHSGESLGGAAHPQGPRSISTLVEEKGGETETRKSEDEAKVRGEVKAGVKAKPNEVSAEAKGEAKAKTSKTSKAVKQNTDDTQLTRTQATEHLQPIYESITNLVAKFLNGLANQGVETVYVFFDELSEADLSGKRFFKIIVRALLTTNTTKPLKRCVRVATYPKDAEIAEGFSEDSENLKIEPFWKSVDELEVDLEATEVAGGRYLEQISQAVFSEYGLDEESVFAATDRNRAWFYRRLYLMGGGSIRNIFIFLGEIPEHTFPVSLDQLAKHGRKHLRNEVKRIKKLTDAKPGVRCAVDKGEEHQSFETIVNVEQISLADDFFTEASKAEDNILFCGRYLFCRDKDAEQFDSAHNYGLCFKAGEIFNENTGTNINIIGMSLFYAQSADLPPIEKVIDENFALQRTIDVPTYLASKKI